eukprot:Nk52_evm13s48 gene=Nk52_evmTU13s48
MKVSGTFCVIAALLVVFVAVQCNAEESSSLQTRADSQEDKQNQFLSILEDKKEQRRANLQSWNPLPNLNSSDVNLGVDALSKLIHKIIRTAKNEDIKKPEVGGVTIESSNVSLDSSLSDKIITFISMSIPVTYFLALAFKTTKVFGPVYNFLKETLAMHNMSIAYSFAAGFWIFLLSVTNWGAAGFLGVGLSLIFFIPYILTWVRRFSNFGLDAWVVEMMAYVMSSFINCLTDLILPEQFLTVLGFIKENAGDIDVKNVSGNAKEVGGFLAKFPQLLAAMGFTAVYAGVTAVGHFFYKPIIAFQNKYHLQFTNAAATVKSIILFIYDIVKARPNLYGSDAEVIPTILMQALSYTKYAK